MMKVLTVMSKGALGNRGGTRTAGRVWGMRVTCVFLPWTLALLAWAQYPGRVETNKPEAPAPTLRAVAVLEWTGEAGKPNASRLVPITVFDGQQFQDGGLYLARPEPLALEGGTEYALEVAGAQKGWFDVASAQQVNGDWFGFGAWKPFVPTAPKKLRPSRVAPQVVHEQNSGNDERPHFKTRPDNNSGSQPDQSSSGTGSQSGSQPAPQGSAQVGGSGNAGSDAPSAPADPERPTLHHRQKGGETAQPAAQPGAPETTINAPDPDRPRLSHGRPADLATSSADAFNGGTKSSTELRATPTDLRQMVAVSDDRKGDLHAFNYEWPTPADAARVESQLVLTAQQLLAKQAASANAKQQPAGGASTSTRGTASMRTANSVGPTATKAATTAHRTTHTTSHATSKAAPKLPPVTDINFHAFALTYGGGATLVLTARTIDDDATRKEIAVIGQEDIYGAVQVLWSSITDAAHLDETPRMHLVDAVDAEGQGRADLLFEARTPTDRRFVLFRIGAGKAERVFFDRRPRLEQCPEGRGRRGQRGHSRRDRRHHRQTKRDYSPQHRPCQRDHRQPQPLIASGPQGRGSCEVSQPPPSAFTSCTLAENCRVVMSAAVRWLASSVVCAMMTSR